MRKFWLLLAKLLCPFGWVVLFEILFDDLGQQRLVDGVVINFFKNGLLSTVKSSANSSWFAVSA